MPSQQGLIWPLPTHKGRLLQRRLSTPLTQFATLAVANFAPRLYAPPFATGYNVLRQVANSSCQRLVLPGQPTIKHLKGRRTEEQPLEKKQVKEVQAKEAVQATEMQPKKASEYADLSSWVHMWR
nr:hypothetical protein B0A51_06528 [Rachicladosporium sp. CCFEE 5018]